MRSLNKVTLIGNLTRDPELRYTPKGAAVCSFGIATNRQWTTDSGDKKEDVEFHRLVAWNKLAEICGQLLGKGRKVFVEGRLQTRKWTGQDEVERTTTEIVISDMILLDSKGAAAGGDFDIPDEAIEGMNDTSTSSSKKPKEKSSVASKKAKAPDESNLEDDIPF